MSIQKLLEYLFISKGNTKLKFITFLWIVWFPAEHQFDFQTKVKIWEVYRNICGTGYIRERCLICEYHNILSSFLRLWYYEGVLSISKMTAGICGARVAHSIVFPKTFWKWLCLYFTLILSDGNFNFFRFMSN